MNWHNKSLSFLNLSNKEVLILNTLIDAKSCSIIAEETKLPRTTVIFIINTLIKKELVLKIKNGKRFRYVAISEMQLSQKLQETINEINLDDKERKGAKIKLSAENEFNVYVGIKEILPAHERIVSMNKDTRIYAIQPNKSWMNLHKKLSPKQLINFNETIRNNKIIIEALLQENAYKLYKIFFENNKEALRSIAESFTDRMADYAFVPEQFFDYHAEVWLFNNTLMIINWEEEIAFEITNADIMSFVKDMFILIKEKAKKIDHNQMMKDLLG